MNARTQLLLPVCAAALVLAGCAAPARVEQMQVDTSLALRTTLATSALKGNIAVKDVTGGRDTNPMWVSNVSSSDFERALEASLRDAGLLSGGKPLGQYQLVAHLLKLDQPFAGASMTVTSTVQYTLIDRASNKDVLSRTVTAPYTAAWNAAFAGVERLKLANEGSMRENIRQLIDLLVAFKPGADAPPAAAGATAKPQP